MADERNRGRKRQHDATRRAVARVGAATGWTGAESFWWLGLAAIGLPEIRVWVAVCIAREVEQRRLFPWLAVAYGAGILAAFAADGPLSPWPALAAAAIFGGAAFLSRHRLARLAAFLVMTFLFAGFASAVARMRSVEAPSLTRMSVGHVEGFVEALEVCSRGGRLTLRVTRLGELDAEHRPARVRVTSRDLAGAVPGDYVSATMRLLPPPEAARPGGYDFGRDAYFASIGAVGSVSGRLTVVADPPEMPGFGLKVAAAVDRARNLITARIAGAIGGQAGAVAAALVTGKRGLIDDHSNDILRAAGIYHIVSISGLHMVLAAGVFFWLTRALLALSPALALHWPIKKIAAAAGMVGAIAYDVFSGSDVATERSLFMILVMEGAILFDRPALSLRNLALSALIVLTREPETLLGPSLQMSYAAVAGLIALAEWSRTRRRRMGDETRAVRAALWVGAAVFGTIATTVIASVATGPFSTYHFQNLQPYGVIGNAVTLPLVSFVVMPAAVIGVVVTPFGLDRPIWIVMGWAVEGVLRLSEWVAGLSGSVVIVPAFETGALALFVVAILLATLCVSPLRWLALAPALLGAAWAAATPRPDLYVARDGASAAVRGPDGRLLLIGRVSAFTAEQWLHADGDARRAGAAGIGEGRPGARCDKIGCVATMADGRSVALVAERRAFAADCRRAAIVLSRLSAPADCAAPLVIDRDVLERRGAVTVRLTPSGEEVTGSRRDGETRAWLARAAAAAPRPSATPVLKSLNSPANPNLRTPDAAPAPDAGLPGTDRDDLTDPPPAAEPEP